MKYAQLLMGLFAGVAIGGSVVAATGTKVGGTVADEEGIKKIVRQVIMNEPKLIIDSVQKMQMADRNKSNEAASEVLKDQAFLAKVYNDTKVGTVGPKDSKRVVVEFFDYNCPACKMQYKEIDTLVKNEKDVRVIFREYPIFGPQSDQNSRIGLAVARLAPEKYFAFYEKMHSNAGRSTEADALKYAKELGLDPAKVKEEAKNPEIDAELASNRELADKLHIQGTPSIVVGDKLIPHAAQAEEIYELLGKK